MRVCALGGSARVIPAVELVRVALRRGEVLELHRASRGGIVWRLRGRRSFGVRTVKLLLDSGEAVRIGDRVYGNAD